MRLSIKDEYTATPGPRFREQGTKSGEEFRQDLLEPKFKQARQSGEKILVDLDGGYGYGSSFLEESFGGLARQYGVEAVLATFNFKSEDEPYLVDDIKRYIRECRKPAKK